MEASFRGQGIVILGVTSSVALALAREFAASGCRLVVGARDMEENETIAHDLHVRHGNSVLALEWVADDFDTHEAFYNACVENLGDSLEGVILCSGYMEDQGAVEKDWEKARRTIDVNFTGSVSILNRFANLFEERGHGFLAVLSSVAGDRGRQSNFIYGSSKAGLSAYLEGLRNRLYHAGVHVLTVKPGFVDTKMTWGLPGLALVASPESVARSIVKAIRKRKNVIYTPWFWRYIMLIVRHIPDWQFKKMRM